MMKFYDTKTDTIQSNITPFWENYCNKHTCTNCAFSAVVPGHRMELCKQWAQNFPVEAANLMDIEPGYDQSMCDKCWLFGNDCPWDTTFTPYDVNDKNCECFFRRASDHIVTTHMTPYEQKAKAEPDDWEAELDKILAEDYGKLLEEFSK